MIPCQHGVMRPHTVNGESLQIWEITANILNKQSGITDKGWYSTFEGGQELTTTQWAYGPD